MDSEYNMVSHELYQFLYNSNQTVHKTPIETSNTIPLIYSNTKDDNSVVCPSE